MADFTSTRTAAEMLQDAVWDVVDNLLSGFVSNDLMIVVTFILSLEIIVVAVTWIYRILTRIPEEREARNAFKAYMYSKGKFDEPIMKRRYEESLADYEIEGFRRHHGDGPIKVEIRS